jgi:hypothetical protein
MLLPSLTTVAQLLWGNTPCDYKMLVVILTFFSGCYESFSFTLGKFGRKYDRKFVRKFWPFGNRLSTIYEVN